MRKTRRCTSSHGPWKKTKPDWLCERSPELGWPSHFVQSECGMGQNGMRVTEGTSPASRKLQSCKMLGHGSTARHFTPRFKSQRTHHVSSPHRKAHGQRHHRPSMNIGEPCGRYMLCNGCAATWLCPRWGKPSVYESFGPTDALWPSFIWRSWQECGSEQPR